MRSRWSAVAVPAVMCGVVCGAPIPAGATLDFGAPRLVVDVAEDANGVDVQPVVAGDAAGNWVVAWSSQFDFPGNPNA